MVGIVLGAASFFVVFWVDVVSLKRIRWIKPLLWLAGIALFLFGLLRAASDPARIAVASSVSLLGWILCVLFGVLLVYSLFIEIPFLSAYVHKGQPLKVISSGTYALCRHPGVLWLGGFLAALFLARGSWALLLAVPVWVALDVLYVVLQEKFFFLQMFGAEYEAYQRVVPMLVPTSRSVRECMRTLLRRPIKMP
jgi:protein-S-isoprenylcysteine O-methyltransferase Ste14